MLASNMDVKLLGKIGPKRQVSKLLKDKQRLTFLLNEENRELIFEILTFVFQFDEMTQLNNSGAAMTFKV